MVTGRLYVQAIAPQGKDHYLPLNRKLAGRQSKELRKKNLVTADSRTNISRFFVIKPTGCTIFTNLFCHETLHVSGSSSVHHQEFIHCTLSNSICHTGLYTAFEQDEDGTAVPSWSCSKTVYKSV